MLDPLGNYGGPTLTMPFLTGSPAAAKGGIVTTLTGNISTTATVIPVADAAVFASTNTQVAIRINSETFWVEAVNLTDNTLNVMRAPGDGAAPTRSARGFTSPTTRSATRSRAHPPSVPSSSWWGTRFPWP